MKKILAIAWNDIKVEFADRSTIIFFIILPLVFTTLIGSALGGSSNDSNTIELPVVDLDGSAPSKQLLADLNASQVVNVTLFNSNDAAHKTFIDNNLPATLVIPQDFGGLIQQGKPVELQLTEQTSSYLMVVDQAVRQAASRLGASISIAQQVVTLNGQLKPFANTGEQQTLQQDILVQAASLLAEPSTSTVLVQAGTQPKIIPNGFKQSSPGQLVTWVLITLLGGSSVFVYERQAGTLRRLMTTPTSKTEIMAGKILGRFSQGMIQMLILVVFGALALHVDWGQDPLALLVLLVAFALMGTALGVMLGAFAKTPGQAGGLSVMFSMLLASLGGAWFPLEITPATFQSAVRVLPTTWAMTGLTNVIVRGYTLVQITPQAGVLLGFAALFFIIGIRKLKFN